MMKAEDNRKLFKLPHTYIFIMVGRIEDEKGNRQSKGSHRISSAGFLLCRIKYLIDHINVTLGLMDANSIRPSFICTDITVDEAMSLKTEISEFLGLLHYFRSEYNDLPIPYSAQINKLKARLGYYFI